MTSWFAIMMDNFTPLPKISDTIYQDFSSASLCMMQKTAKPLTYHIMICY